MTNTAAAPAAQEGQLYNVAIDWAQVCTARSHFPFLPTAPRCSGSQPCMQNLMAPQELGERGL